MNDQEYAAWFASLPAWKRGGMLVTAVLPFVAMLVVIVLGFAGVIK